MRGVNNQSQWEVILSVLSRDAALLLSALLGACGSVVQAPMSKATVAVVSQSIAARGYAIGRGDEVDLRFPYTPELNAVATVRPDGMINLPLIGDVAVAGLSPTGLSQVLRGRYADQLRRPEVTVNVRGFVSQRIFVGGEVLRPGVQPLIGSMSVLQAIMAADGLRETARPSEVVIVRRGVEPDSRLVFSVNLDDIVSGRDTAQDVALQAADVILVPRSGIANVNLWVDQYLRRNLLFTLGATYIINPNTSTNQAVTTPVPTPIPVPTPAPSVMP